MLLLFRQNTDKEQKFRKKRIYNVRCITVPVYTRNSAIADEPRVASEQMQWHGRPNKSTPSPCVTTPNLG